MSGRTITFALEMLLTTMLRRVTHVLLMLWRIVYGLKHMTFSRRQCS